MSDAETSGGAAEQGTLTKTIGVVAAAAGVGVVASPYGALVILAFHAGKWAWDRAGDRDELERAISRAMVDARPPGSQIITEPGRFSGWKRIDRISRPYRTSSGRVADYLSGRSLNWIEDLAEPRPATAWPTRLADELGLREQAGDLNRAAWDHLGFQLEESRSTKVPLASDSYEFTSSTILADVKWLIDGPARQQAALATAIAIEGANDYGGGDDCTTSYEFRGRAGTRSWDDAHQELLAWADDVARRVLHEIRTNKKLRSYRDMLDAAVRDDLTRTQVVLLADIADSSRAMSRLLWGNLRTLVLMTALLMVGLDLAFPDSSGIDPSNWVGWVWERLSD